jgi:hypothetical protein
MKETKFLKGKDNPNWKGNKVSYFGMHRWVEYNKPKPELCERCKKEAPKDLSNISGKYKRDINDYEWLCRKCHMLVDGRTKPLNICLRCKKQTKNKYYCSYNCSNNGHSRKKGDLFFCPGCKQYLKKELFNSSKSKKYGIYTFCKKCRSKKYYQDKKIS